MAARRLIIVMVVLLCVSTGIAILIPNPNVKDDQSATGTSGTTGVTAETGPTGPGKATPNASKTVTAVVQPGKLAEDVNVSAGDRLLLSVEVRQTGDIGIEGLGLTATATEYEAARFDILLPPEKDTFKVIRVNGGDLIAKIVSSARGPDKSDKSPEPQAKTRAK